MRAFLTFATLFSMLNTAHAVKIVGNGGDTYAVEFVSIATDVLEYVQVNDSETYELLKNVLKTTKVESTDQYLVLDGVPKEAINYPSENRIIFNRAAWSNAKESYKPVFVLHEYLGVVGIDDSSYAHSTALMKGFGFGKNMTEVEGPFTVNFATNTQYLLNAYVTIENFGPKSWQYRADEEQIHLVVELNGKRKVFKLPTRGHVISAYSGYDGIDDGIYIRILQPLEDKSGRKKKIDDPASYSEYYQHVIRDYRVEFHSNSTDGLPEEADFSGPISNLAG